MRTRQEGTSYNWIPRCDIQRSGQNGDTSEAIDFWPADRPIQPAGCRNCERSGPIERARTVAGHGSERASDTTFDVRLAQINRTYPRIDLRPTRFASYMMENIPGISWEPDLDVCLDFFLRFNRLINENPDEASSVLLTFRRDHQMGIRVEWLGGFRGGWICLGAREGFRPEGKPRAAKFFKSYWTTGASPKSRESRRPTFC